MSRGYGKSGAEAGMGKTACLRFSSSTSLFRTGNSICISVLGPRIFRESRAPDLSGTSVGEWVWETRALSAGIRAYLSQIVELSSSMSIYVLALTWLSYFNDFICQSPVLFTRLTGRMRNFCTPIEINRDCRAAQMCSFPRWFARVSWGTIAFSSLFIY